MTPSGWHDDARSRDAGHDEMQAAVWRWASGYKGDGEAQFEWVVVEHPFISRERYGTRIVAFGDVVGKFSDCDRFVAFEIKPKIDSVGAVIRQLASLQHAATRVIDRNSGRAYPVDIRAVVPAGDPKLPLLRELSEWRVIAWDMARGEPAP